LGADASGGISGSRCARRRRCREPRRRGSSCGSTENTTLVTELIVGLSERGLNLTRPVLVVLDGSKALRRAVLEVFDRPVLGRCQLYKIRNVQDRLPDKLRSVVASRMRRAYHADSALAAEAELAALAAELDRTHPGAAASLREGMAETLTVLRLNMPPTLARTFRSTNATWVLGYGSRAGRCSPVRCSPRSALTLNAIDTLRGCHGFELSGRPRERGPRVAGLKRACRTQPRCAATSRPALLSP